MRTYLLVYTSLGLLGSVYSLLSEGDELASRVVSVAAMMIAAGALYCAWSIR